MKAGLKQNLFHLLKRADEEMESRFYMQQKDAEADEINSVCIPGKVIFCGSVWWPKAAIAKI